ncbi:hypothetical protein ACET9W_15645 [Aeromonas veronii]
MTDQVISKLVNQVSFKIDNKSWRDAQNKIKRLAGMWHKSSQGFSKAMEQGRRASTLQAKATDRQIRTELKAYRNRKTTIKADQIRHQQKIKDDIGFRQQLQKTNMAFLQGNLSARERAATVSNLVKQYRALNQQASRYNQSSKGLGAIKSIARGGMTTAAAGLGVGVAATVGGGMAVQNQYNKIKEQGQDFEGMKISFQNTFGDRWLEISSIARQIADEAGADILTTGKALVNYVSIVQALGVETDKAINLYKKQSNMTASYGMSKDQIAGFQYGLMQTMSSNTLEDFKQTFDWSPQIKGDFLKFVKETMNIGQKELMGNLTNGKYNFKQIWLKFVESTAPKYEQMSAKFKQSSMAQDARVGNELSTAILRIFESSGFKDAMQFANKIISLWANTLENNATKIGEVFGNLYKIVAELGEGGFKVLSTWLSELTAQDIKGFFYEVKGAVQDFAYVVRSVANFIRSFIPEQTTPTPLNVAKERTASKEQQTSNWLNSGSTYGPVISIPQPTFKAPSFQENLVSSRAIREQAPSNFSGKLDLKINAEVNEQGFSRFVDYKIQDNNMHTINLLSN